MDNAINSTLTLIHINSLYDHTESHTESSHHTESHSSHHRTSTDSYHPRNKGNSHQSLGTPDGDISGQSSPRTSDVHEAHSNGTSKQSGHRSGDKKYPRLPPAGSLYTNGWAIQPCNFGHYEYGRVYTPHQATLQISFVPTFDDGIDSVPGSWPPAPGQCSHHPATKGNP